MLLAALFMEEAEAHAQVIARPLMLQISTFDETHLDAVGSVARFEGLATAQRVTAPEPDLDLLPDPA